MPNNFYDNLHGGNNVDNEADTGTNNHLQYALNTLTLLAAPTAFGTAPNIGPIL